MARRKNTAIDISTDIFCPKCRDRIGQAVLATASPSCRMSCSKCKGWIQVRHAFIRAKASRQNIASNLRSLSIRAEDYSGETLIVFSKNGIDDLELRSGDSVVFIWLNGAMREVRNLTINVRYSVEQPQLASGVPIWLAAIIIMILGLIFLSAILKLH